MNVGVCTYQDVLQPGFSFSNPTKNVFVIPKTLMA
jgi:hypothetical protein